jgi:hypothetical protein
MKVVVDTNVLVSRVIVPAGVPAQILKKWEEGAFELLVSEPILSECLRVLSYKRIRARHQLSDDQIAATISGLREFATVVNVVEKLEVIKEDPDDNKIIECAIAGDAEYVVSGDVHLLSVEQYQGIPILSPRVFLTMLTQ